MVEEREKKTIFEHLAGNDFAGGITKLVPKKFNKYIKLLAFGLIIGIIVDILLGMSKFFIIIPLSISAFILYKKIRKEPL
jgi:hypothetical protein